MEEGSGWVKLVKRPGISRAEKEVKMVNKLICAKCGKSWYSAATPDTLLNPDCECKGKLLLNKICNKGNVKKYESRSNSTFTVYVL